MIQSHSKKCTHLGDGGINVRGKRKRRHRTTGISERTGTGIGANTSDTDATNYAAETQCRLITIC